MEYNIENEEGILIQGKGNYCSKLKKGKLKTKKLLKITILGEQEHSVQSADRNKAVQIWPWGNMYLPKPVKWPSQHLYLQINSGFHARKNPKQQYLKVITSRSVMLHSAKSALIFTTMQPRYWTDNHLAQEKVWQKPGLFVLRGNSHILNLPTVCIKLTQGCGRV